MHIAVIADVLGEENNGTSITVKRLITNLKKRGHEVLVVAPGNPDEKDYYPVDKIDFKIFNDYVAKNGVVLAKPNEDLLRSVIEKSDVVHALMPFPLGRSAVRICNEMHKPLTTAFHVQPENVSSHFGLQKSKPVNSYIYKNFFNGFYRFSDYIHCPTEFIADQLRRHGYTQDLRIISNGVDPSFVPGNDPKPDEYADKFCILSTGRLVKEKCQSELLKAAALSKYADKLQIFLAGDGPQEKRLQKLGSKLPNPPVISFMKKRNSSARSTSAISMYIALTRKSNPSPAWKQLPAASSRSLLTVKNPPQNILRATKAIFIGRQIPKISPEKSII